MNTPQSLPEYTDATLAAVTADQLLELLARDEDRVPRNVIDECARRGDAMVSALHGLLDQGSGWDDEDTIGQWWRLLHAVMILGLIPTEAAGLLLVQYMRRMSEEDDRNLQDWLAGHWPAFFGNKHESLMSALRALCADRDCDWYIRANARDALVAMAQCAAPTTLNEILESLATAARDETEDLDYRLLTANALLDFPRPQYRELLEGLAKQQKGFGVVFSAEDVAKAYVEEQVKPKRNRLRQEPWVFYETQAIAARQERWAKEDQEEHEREKLRETTGDSFEPLYDPYVPLDPYVRPEPKIGRNDPCPCGSGKKYKKCCLSDGTAT